MFKGYNKLILGFNTFLPEGEGYKIEITAEDEAAAAAAQQEKAAAQQEQANKQAAAVAAATAAASTAAASVASQPAVATVQGEQGGYRPQAMQQQHAISYVTQIRNRFANEPETYRAFLKILHTYQKEQKGIKDVLEQVSQLFAEHPDLLMEFTYFLPDAVQEQAKERLHRAAAESEMRKKQRMLEASQSNYIPPHTLAPATTGAKRSRAEKDRDKELAKQTERETKKGNSNQARKIAKRNKDLANTTLPTYDSMGNHSISSERKYFDHVKDLFTSTTRDGWSEFVKCLELYSHDAISRKDMMQLVRDLFGPTNVDLYEEFKALLSHRAAYDSSAADMWYAIPLSEIDFSQCFKCTPSYRALPKDYPRPVCSERSHIDASVLNNDWVSIPIGSEESFYFKHMRKNVYEEALFRCEDERFEIDMCIDSNLATIKILEPIAEEIENLRVLEEDGRSPKFNLQLEKRNLSVVHLSSIARIYGDNGTEILELLKKNPVGAIPVILKRLKQKDVEWNKAKQELNKGWNDTIEKNYERSFDHQALSFKLHDKRFYSAKNLVNDVKGGNNEMEQYLLQNAPGIAYDVVPALEGTLAGMTPHLSLQYDASNLGALRDIYRVVCHAMECSGMNVNDKERIASLWRDLLRVFFNMPVHFLYDNAVSSGVTCVPAAENSSTISTGTAAAAGNQQGTVNPVNMNIESIPIDPNEAYQVGTKVLTLYGSGTVLHFRTSDNTYQVQLPYGVGYLRPSIIIGAEQLSINALEAIGVVFDGQGNEFIAGQPRPPAPKDPASLVKDPCKLFYGNQMSYTFFRLHHTLYWRLVMARKIAMNKLSEDGYRGSVNVPENMRRYEHPEDESAFLKPKDKYLPVYNAFMSQLFSLMDGSIDGNKYEDTCRQLLSNKGYFVYTLDKIIQQLLKCLQSMANDENVTKLVGMFMYYRTHADGIDPALYQRHIGSMFGTSLEDVYRIQLMTKSQHETQEPITVGCQLMGTVVDMNKSISTSASGNTTTM